MRVTLGDLGVLVLGVPLLRDPIILGSISHPMFYETLNYLALLLASVYIMTLAMLQSSTTASVSYIHMYIGNSCKHQVSS